MNQHAFSNMYHSTSDMHRVEVHRVYGIHTFRTTFVGCEAIWITEADRSHAAGEGEGTTGARDPFNSK